MAPLRLFNLLCRTGHTLAVSTLLGGCLWGVGIEQLWPAVWTTIGSGIGLLVAESFGGAAWLTEGRGLAVLLKLALVALVPLAGGQRAVLLVVIVIVASIGSHMPSRFRHASLVAALRVGRHAGEPAGSGDRIAAVPAHKGRGTMNRFARIGLLGLLWVLASGQASGPAHPLAALPALPRARPEQVELGRLLFFDPRLSGDGGVACASCHDPDTGWGDGKALSAGYPGSDYFRNAQTLLNAAHYRRNYWDGRMAGSDLPTLVRDHLTEAHFMQVDGRLVTERLKQVPQYVELFQKAFGAEPNFGRTITAVAAFVRTLTSRNAPVDRYLAGDPAALSDEARRGLALFTGKAGCSRCHGGPLFSDEGFHALGVPDNPAVFADPLRHVSFRRFFRTLGAPAVEAYREDPGLYGVTKEKADWGKFRTPSLREVSRTAPYMHNGSLATLDAVVAFYDAGGGPHQNKSPRLQPLGLDAGEQRALVEFLKSLAGDAVAVEPPDPPDYQPRTLGKN